MLLKGWVLFWGFLGFFGFVLFNSHTQRYTCHVCFGEGVQGKTTWMQFNPGHLLLPSHFSSYHLAFYEQPSWNVCSFQTDMLSYTLGLIHFTIPSNWLAISYTPSGLSSNFQQAFSDPLRLGQSSQHHSDCSVLELPLYLSVSPLRL